MKEQVDFLSSRVQYISVERIRPNPQQPRRDFSDDSLEELAYSIATHGILQPLTVRKVEEGYELIAGERRLRAAKWAGLRQVPCLIARVGEEDAGLLALIENIQRRDLNCFEEAEAIAGLMRRYELNQEDTARKLGKSQSAVANKLRLLRLPETIRREILESGLTERHARTLLRLNDAAAQQRVLTLVIRRKLNVAQTEALVEQLLQEIQTETPARRCNYVIKDVRIFLNSIQHSLTVMQQAGVAADLGREDTEEDIVLTIRIPKAIPAK